jgi:hypothetical protein
MAQTSGCLMRRNECRPGARQVAIGSSSTTTRVDRFRTISAVQKTITRSAVGYPRPLGGADAPHPRGPSNALLKKSWVIPGRKLGPF